MHNYTSWEIYCNNFKKIRMETAGGIVYTRNCLWTDGWSDDWGHNKIQPFRHMPKSRKCWLLALSPFFHNISKGHKLIILYHTVLTLYSIDTHFNASTTECF